MTLNVLLTGRPVEDGPVIFADPGGRGVEPVLAGLSSQLGELERLMFPLPDETTRRHVTPPAVMRTRHADLWHALRAEERARVLLVAGPTAACLAPVVATEPAVVVAVPHPGAVMTRAPSAWRCVLGAFPELDELPDEAGSPEDDQDDWHEQIRTATSRLQLIRTPDAAGVTREVATGLGLGPKAATRAATAAAEEEGDRREERRRQRPGHWVDEILYSLSRPPAQGRRSRKRRRA